METGKITLLNTIHLPEFPSGSSIEYYNKWLYLVGDDATHVLKLDTAYQESERIFFDSSDTHRISKETKADYEASFVTPIDGVPHLLLVGSGSTKARRNALLIPIENTSSELKTIELNQFLERWTAIGIAEVNIEGAAAVNDKVVFANRANKTNTNNYFIVTDTSFLHNQSLATFIKIKVSINNTGATAGISGLSYLPVADILFFTASTEETANAYDDGAIGDSYVGYIKNFSSRLTAAELTPDVLINLSTKHTIFSKHKIESICIEHYDDNKVIAHLIADDDDGATTLFKISLQL